MRIKDIITQLEELSPTAYAEDFDNVGLLVGDSNQEVNGVLVTLDTLEVVVDEAIEKNCNLIVTFHPIIFSGLKKLNGKNYVERVVIKAIQNNIAIYAIHTALDNSIEGVNARICQQLGLNNRKVLLPKKGTIKKLTTFVPKKNAESVREALFAAGAGTIGNYSHCSFNVEGQGSFKPEENANPTIGTVGKTHFEAEVQIGITFLSHLQGQVMNALKSSHPYEEIAYEIVTLDNTNQTIGMGMVGTLDDAMNEKDFLNFLKDRMNADCVRHSALLDKPIKKVAVLGGSGSFAIGAAKRAGADAFITADLKYHQFYEAEGKILLADIGHYETEQYTKNLIVDHLTKKIPNFAIVLSEHNTNPIKYS